MSKKVQFATNGRREAPDNLNFLSNRVRYYRGRVSNFDQSESRKHCFLASDWLKL